MGIRLDHLRESKAWHNDLYARSARIGLSKRRWSWRSWRRHPFANFAYWYWNTVPHKPKWELEETSIGEVNHSRRTAAWVSFHDSCARCGFTDMGDSIEFWPRRSDEIKVFLESCDEDFLREITNDVPDSYGS